jgi:hypothetical protein
MHSHGEISFVRLMIDLCLSGIIVAFQPCQRHLTELALKNNPFADVDLRNRRSNFRTRQRGVNLLSRISLASRQAF